MTDISVKYSRLAVGMRRTEGRVRCGQLLRRSKARRGLIARSQGGVGRIYKRTRLSYVIWPRTDVTVGVRVGMADKTGRLG